MKLERKKGNTEWFADGALKMRVKKLDDKRVCIWVSKNGKNACLSMFMYEFIGWCEEENGLEFHIDQSWNNHRGVIVNHVDQMFAISEIQRFIEECKLDPSEKADKFSDEEWYQ